MTMLDGRIVLVTGAAGGIGRSSVESFLGYGAKVVGFDLHPAADWAELRGRDNFLGLQGDHCNQEDVAKAYVAAQAAFGRVDGLYCNAGKGYAGDYSAIDTPALEAAFANHVSGAYNMVQGFLSQYDLGAETSAAPAAIVFTSSRLGHKARPNMVQYAVAKHGLQGLMRSLAEDLGPRGIRVNAVCPGMVATDVARDMVEAYAKDGNTDAVFARLAAEYPLRRLTEAKDVAEAAAFLLSSRAKAIHATSLAVDCGVHGF